MTAGYVSGIIGLNMAERESNLSVSRLIQEQTRLSKLIESRKSLYWAIGEGDIKEGADIKTDTKIGKARGDVEASRLRAENHKAAVGQDLERLVEEQKEDLISKADKYD